MSTVNIPLGASIQAAINANPAGTVFQLADGTYRGQQFEPLSNDQFIGAADGGTILSGAIVLSNWSQSGNYWVATGLPAQSVGGSVSGSSPLASDLNDLFINNVLYTPVSSLSQVTAGTWYYDAARQSAYISANLTGQTAELSVTSGMTYNNGATGVVFENLTTEKYATNAQTAPIQTGTGWSIINVTSTQNHGAGLYIGGPDTVVQGGSYSDNGQIGIDGSSANGSEVIDAQINDNNYAGYNTGWDAGGIKVTNTNGFTVSGDTVSNNNGQGIWADVDSSNWTVSGNTAADNSGNGIQYEISHGTTSIDNNTVTDNGGSGIYISNADGVDVSGNTVTVNPSNVFNSLGAAEGGGIDVINNSGRGDDPSGVPYQSINDDVHNNVIVQTNNAADNGIWTFQALPADANDVFNSNTYYVPNGTGTFWHFGSTNYTWAALQQAATYEKTGIEITGLPQTVASPNGSRIESASALPIIDASGNSWTLVQSASKGLQIAVNGVVDPITANVVLLEILNGTMTQEIASGLWFSEPGPSGPWTNIPAPPTVVSPNGSVIDSATASPIIDASGNAWSLVKSASNGLQIAVNGVVDPVTANAVLLETLNGKMVQEISSGLWFSESGPTGSWSNIPAPSISVTANATGATTTISGATVGSTTAAGSIFSLTAPGVAKVTLGSTSDTIKFSGMSSAAVTGGAAAATITVDGGNNTFTGGTGAMTITAPLGPDSFIYHATDRRMTINDFSFANGDSLTVDKALQASMTETSDRHGGVILAFGSTSPGVDLVGVTSVTASQIHFV